ncbi:hypothetical protein M409DRAFT_50847 [Zasmidium cellare ATCC 36951]|uniref:PH domain-containing protein n=1 Tax=Zasmidium cellare ATCC 36951 TaxID=1080233 RepID=A0A6A6CWC3_ZASCE|nr:uncharacterized protein M409DRAFT_50847 [Zasmidium cellare ATCC 36951]KAF2171401.1 hypothetical protein M409DRAFT_50847 [Zasmidium cellare ATCC 36951]
MSDVHNTTAAPVVAETVVEPAAPVAVTDASAPVEEPKVDAEAPKTEATEPAVEEAKTEAAPAEEAKPETAEKPIEPITEGQLAYKGPGLVKSLIPSKKEFWLSDEAVAPQNLDLFLRGEKPEISHAIVAWASQTGKGLLFFNKKNETDRTHPHDVLALYDATDLKKSSPHEFSFKLHGQNHVFKATSDAERDGWYLSIEKSIELGKASKEEVRESEGYKAEIEKLNKPNTVLGAASKRSQSQPKKSVDADKAVAERTGSTEEDKEDKKSRSTSRGILGRLQGKKEEAEQKVAEKREEKEADKEEKKADEEATPIAASTEAAPASAAVATAEIPAAAEAAEALPAEEKKDVEEKPKPSKRSSIFGKAWGSMKSPAKEKEQKDVELKPEAAKDGAVSENPPVLPETATTEPVTEPAVPAVEEPVADAKAEEKKDVPADAVSPGKEKSNFLSGLGFMKRNRSVSPSANLKEPAKKEEAAEVKPTEETPVVESEAKKEEPVVAEPAVEAATTETSAEKAEAPKTETSTPNKRQSVLGSLGRRASKALNRMNAPKKENAAPATTEAKKEEVAETKPVEETPVVNGESKKEPVEEQQKSIGDVVPDAVNVGQPQHTTPAVTASA